MTTTDTGARPDATRRIGLVSDTHGLVRPSVFQALAAVEGWVAERL